MHAVGGALDHALAIEARRSYRFEGALTNAPFKSGVFGVTCGCSDCIRRGEKNQTTIRPKKEARID